MPLFNAYEYESLSESDTIRLIHLDPATDNSAPLSCQIAKHRLSNHCIDYSAVSYTWEKQSCHLTLEIRCDDDVSYLRIPPNVDALLRRFRAPISSRYLWIDAICLNQHDETEKAAQIPYMGRIYESAKSVEIWLGPESHTISDLFAFFKALSTIPDFSRWKTQTAMAERIYLIMKQFFGDPGTALGAIYEFFQRPWFLRRWVIQEACQARTANMYCGSQSLPIDTMKLAAIRFQRLDIADYPIKMMASLGRQTSQLSILELLWHFHRAVCLDNKDRIASLWSLAHPKYRFKMDYTRSWSEIYQDLTLSMYHLNENDISLQLLFHLFEFGALDYPIDALFPSWIPDWSQPRHRALPYLTDIQNTDTFEPYPCSFGNNVLTVVRSWHRSLYIHWRTSFAESGGYRVKFAATFDSETHSEVFRQAQVVGTIRELFPGLQNAEENLVIFTSMLKSVSEFRHADVDRERTSRCLGEFEVELSNSLTISKMGARELLHWLRTLDSILAEFCLVELEVSGRKCGYSIGPKRLQVNDLLIPLWSVQPSDSISFMSESVVTDVQLTTMLAVRCVEDYSEAMGNVDNSCQIGKVVGPAVCVMTKPGVGNDRNETIDSGADITEQQSDWSFIRLL